MILSIYSIAYAAIFLVAQVLPILVWPPGRRHVKSIAAVGAVAVVAYVPLIVIMLRTGAAGVLSANGPPSVSESSRIFQQLASGSVPDFFAATAVTTVITVIAVVCWVVSAAELISRARATPSGTETVYLGILLSWLLVPVILDAICSLTYRSIYNSSFLLQSVPAGMILVAFVVAKLLPRKLSAPLAVGLGALLVLSLVPTYGVSFEDWGKASHFILTSAQPQGLSDRQQEVCGLGPRLLLSTRRWGANSAPARASGHGLGRSLEPVERGYPVAGDVCDGGFALPKSLDRIEPCERRRPVPHRCGNRLVPRSRFRFTESDAFLQQGLRYQRRSPLAVAVRPCSARHRWWWLHHLASL